MTRTLLISFVLAGLFGALAAVNAQQTQSKPKTVLRHLVLFKFKDDVSQAQVMEVVEAFGRLKDEIDLIQDFEWGTDVSVENKAQGFTHGFLVTFADAAARDKYLPHPAHQKFTKLAGPRIDKVLVFDYQAQR